MRITPAYLLLLGTLSIPSHASAPSDRPLVGFVLHFDFINKPEEAWQLLDVAQKAGAQVINLVPPAHVWDRPDALAILDELIRRIDAQGLKLVITRIDASYPPDASGRRWNFLYGTILTKPGVMPDGSATAFYFRTTAGIPEYETWMEDETRFYARRYGKLPNLLAINLGPFSEPFASERGGFLEFSQRTELYEITQYTGYAMTLWHVWLKHRFNTLEAANKAYGTTFSEFESIPLPVNEEDPRFGQAPQAFFDFVRCLNDWFVERYERCRRIWHEESGRKDVPFLLQFSGFEAEKIEMGRHAYAAFDLASWIKNADGLGLSIYLNSGYPDYGRHSIEQMVQLLATGRRLGKPIFVLEGGCEAPTSVLDHDQLAFYASAAVRLHPVTYIYEFLKDTINEPSIQNSGKLIAADGTVREGTFREVRRLLGSIRYSP